MNLSDSVALVTGACGGIGSTITRDLLSKGGKVLMADIAGENVTKELQEKFGAQNVCFKHCDVTKDEHWKAAFEECEKKYGKINILVNSAGIGDEVDFLRTIDIYLVACIRGTRMALERMGKDKGFAGGTVVNVASILGVMSFPLTPIYSATKAALVQYTRTLGDDFHFKETGVRIQAVCPYVVDTEFPAKTVNYFQRSKAFLEKFWEEDQLQLKTEEVSSVVMNLLSEGPSGAVMVIVPEKEPFHLPSTEIDTPVSPK